MADGGFVCRTGGGEGVLRSTNGICASCARARGGAVEPSDFARRFGLLAVGASASGVRLSTAYCFYLWKQSYLAYGPVDRACV